MNKFLILILCLSVFSLYAEEKHGHHDNLEEEGHGHHGGGKAIGQGKAILEVDEHKGFKLSPEAIKTLGIQFSASSSKLTIKSSTLVSAKGEKGVYIYRSNFFKLITIKITKQIDDGYIIELGEFKDGDQIVVGGVGLLRVSDIYSTDKSEYGHGH